MNITVYKYHFFNHRTHNLCWFTLSFHRSIIFSDFDNINIFRSDRTQTENNIHKYKQNKLCIRGID